MNFKIVNPGANYPDILLHRYRDDDNGIEKVRIITFGTFIDGSERLEDYCVEETIKFEDPITAIRFIIDFSEESSIDWCKRVNIKY